jgi:cytochrome c-type biogenesis protein CcmF
MDFSSLTFADVSRNFGRRRALARVSFRCDAGEILALLGPNGAGKSTLLSIAATLLAPSAGAVRYGDASAGTGAAALRGRIGVLGHDLYLYPELSAAENLLFFGRVYGLTDVEGRVAAALERAELASRRDEMVAGFSRGMRQRLALERALLHEPRLVLLDEPFTGLDDTATVALRRRLDGPMFPTLSEAVRGERLTVGPPFFNKWMLPIGLMLLLLTGIGPLLAWRKSSFSNMFHQFLWPTTAALVTGAALAVFGVRVWASGICFALCAFVTVTIGQEFIRGAFVRKGATGSDIVTAMIGLVSRSKRRYGGYIVHVGMVLIFFGFAGQGFKQEEQALLKPGEEVKVGSFTVRHDALRVTSDSQKQMITGHVTVSEDGQVIGQLEPARWYFNKREDEPTTEVAIRHAPGEDLYVVLANYDVAKQQATYAVTVNPLVNWIWFGFGVVAIGTVLALMPETAFAFAAAQVPGGAATTGALLLLMLLPASAGVRAFDDDPPPRQHVENPLAAPAAPRSELEKQLQSEIICMCQTCGRKRIGECTCGMAAEMRAEVAGLVSAGKTREEVYAFYVQKYGSQEPLASPIDKGFNRLAWLFPYLMGASGAALVGFAAFKWSRVPGAPPSTDIASTPAENAALQSRLDDELRELD